MEPLTWMSLCFVPCLMVVVLWCSGILVNKKAEKYPGPTILETIWGLMTMRGELHILFTKWAEEYGALYSVFLGVERYFILNDAALVREAFARQECSGRPAMVTLDPYFTGTKGLMNIEGKEFSDHKKFSVSTLKEFGFGRPEMGTQIMDQVAQLLSSLKAEEGQPFFVKKKFIVPVMNALWIPITNKPISKNDHGPELGQLFCSYLSALEKLCENPVLIVNPNIAKLFSWLPILRKYRQAYSKVYQYLDEVIDQHKITIASGEPRDLIDAYLQKSDSVTDTTSIFNKGTHLVDLLLDFLIAGSETSSVVLEWSLLYMVKFPEIQKLAREELQRVVGLDRLPELKDRPNLPFIEATVYEICRLCPPTTTGIPHKILQDFRLKDYTLPKNSHILANIYFIQRDPAAWEGGDPDDFRPDRFLDKKTGRVSKPINENFIPFLTGLRKCIGRPLALDTLFLFLSGIFSRFEIQAHPDYPPPTFGAAGGFSFSPKNFPVLIKPIIALN